jgi:ubiquinone/menaquinone biosynthesis C-methylase UbiE
MGPGLGLRPNRDDEHKELRHGGLPLESPRADAHLCREGELMAETALARWTDRIGFAARQTARVAWYAGHGAAMRRLLDRQPGPRRPVRRPSKPVPDTGKLLADVAALLARDLANVEAGHYPPPQDDEGDLAEQLARSRAFFRDVPEVARRRREGIRQEVVAGNGAAGRRPRYYLQNFHFQSGGWLTEESAALYDMQVEVLFQGAANAMRRQGLVPLADELRGRDQRKLLFADIATGTGSFLLQARHAFPRLPALAIDLSEPYLVHTRRRLGRVPAMQPVVAKAEALPLADGALDAASAVFLFHELPPKIRRQVAVELGRVIRPGGLFIFVDSLQTGDEPDYDGLLELFPQLFHEPYFEGYLAEDLAALFKRAGFMKEGDRNAFFSKVVQFRRER